VRTPGAARVRGDASRNRNGMTPIAGSRQPCRSAQHVSKRYVWLAKLSERPSHLWRYLNPNPGFPLLDQALGGTAWTAAAGDGRAARACQWTSVGNRRRSKESASSSNDVELHQGDISVAACRRAWRGTHYGTSLRCAERLTQPGCHCGTGGSARLAHTFVGFHCCCRPSAREARLRVPARKTWDTLAPLDEFVSPFALPPCCESVTLARETGWTAHGRGAAAAACGEPIHLQRARRNQQDCLVAGSWSCERGVAR
jgi:hypothetical protein